MGGVSYNVPSLVQIYYWTSKTRGEFWYKNNLLLEVFITGRVSYRILLQRYYLRHKKKEGVSNIPANKLFEIQITGRVLIQNALIIGDIKLLGENQILLQRYYLRHKKKRVFQIFLQINYLRYKKEGDFWYKMQLLLEV